MKELKKQKEIDAIRDDAKGTYVELSVTSDGFIAGNIRNNVAATLNGFQEHRLGAGDRLFVDRKKYFPKLQNPNWKCIPTYAVELTPKSVHALIRKGNLG